MCLKMTSLHAENTLYNTVLSKAYQKRGGRIELYIGNEVFILGPDEVIEKLKEAGVNISRKTLYNWEQWGLIPQAIFRNSRRTDYPEHTWTEVYAVEKLRKAHRITVEPLKEIRTLALKVEGQKITGRPSYPKKKKGEPWTWDDFMQGKDEPEIPDFVAEWVQMMDDSGGWTKAGFVVEWVQLKHSKLLPNCKCDICTSGPLRTLTKVMKMAGTDVVVTGRDIEQWQAEDEELSE